MASSEDILSLGDRSSFSAAGMVLLALATVTAGWFFIDGLDALLLAWQTPEYSHGPLIPVLSALMFLRELKQCPPQDGPVPDRWPGVAVIAVAFLSGALGKLSQVDDIVAYATIIWVAGIILVTMGWSRGRHFWPSVLHLVYMLPLPGVLYYKVSTGLQMISSEIGVGILKLLAVPVFLEGNIIDLGVMRLHVAEACSGLRYLFPIMSFSYIFAVLYQGPKWHKAVLLLAAVPITVFMNSVRIAMAGIIANVYGIEWLEGFTHFFEGWVIFIICIVLLFGLARLMLLFHPGRPRLADALDLDTSGLMAQASRIRLVRPSAAMAAAAALGLVALGAWQLMPETRSAPAERSAFALFPTQLGDWRQRGPEERLTPEVARTLGADDYRQATLARDAATPPVGLFMAFYHDQSKGGVHSPEICLPASGWEIAKLERVDIAPRLGIDGAFPLNRAIIQKGEARMMVFYWFQQGERRVAWDFAAKFYLLADGIRTGQTDGGIVRLTTMMSSGESEDAAEARLLDMTRGVIGPLPKFIPH
ncbi:VPLPA-CTERM-specific exosortase XrtD [Paracoccus sp. (in: a-proteobacteria)]|uniref:VPLPA-CTERM-specific exosortase XrtD n=1 Tax=Paracoccus sp. TaxID=267 RepID=UPI0035B1F0F0